MRSLILTVILAACLYAREPIFVLHCIDPHTSSEGVAVMDINGDGRLDITCGQYWYEQPAAAWSQKPAEKKFAPRYVARFVGDNQGRKEKFIDDTPNPGPDAYRWKPHLYRLTAPGQATDAQGRQRNFAGGWFDNNYGEFAVDVNRNGRLDLISGGWFHPGIYWFENPGPGRDGMWTAHRIGDDNATEGILVVDVDGNGRLDVIPNHYAPQGIWWYEIKDDLTVARHDVGKHGDIHGIGFGDIDGDGRGDIITINGWYRAPEDPRAGAWQWVQEEGFKDGSLGATGIPILVYDVNGNGYNDLIYGAGHNYGVFWLEQVVVDGKRSWRKHVIDDTWSQAHTMVLADLNGDGRPELVTGKRLYGHGGGDPGAHEPQGVYYYTLDPQGPNYTLDPPGPTFTRHVMTYNAGVGVGAQLAVIDIDKDGDLDVVCPGQGGLYVLENRGSERR